VFSSDARNRFTTEIHEGLRLDKFSRSTFYLTAADQGTTLSTADDNPFLARQFVNHQKPQVMPCSLVLFSGVTQSDNEKHFDFRVLIFDF
jgi:hypothetical protein